MPRYEWTNDLTAIGGGGFPGWFYGGPQQVGVANSPNGPTDVLERVELTAYLTIVQYAQDGQQRPDGLAEVAPMLMAEVYDPAAPGLPDPRTIGVERALLTSGFQSEYIRTGSTTTSNTGILRFSIPLVQSKAIRSLPGSSGPLQIRVSVYSPFTSGGTVTQAFYSREVLVRALWRVS